MYLASRLLNRQFLLLSRNNGFILKTRVHLQTSASVQSHGKSSKSSKKYISLLKDMPKKIEVKELQGIRLGRRNKLKRYPPQIVYLQVLGSGAPGAPKSLYVFTEQARYLFNCGEGSQRLAYEHKVKLAMIEHILITHKSWSNVGGLPGVLLTLQDTGVPDISIHGPPGVDSLYYDTRHFMRFRDMEIEYQYYAKNDGVSDYGPLTIQSVPLWAKEESTGDPSDGRDLVNENKEEVEDLYGYEHQYKKPQFISQKITQQKMKESVNCRSLSIAYICRPPPKAGKLLLEKCVEAGVPPGPLFGDLKNGKDITLPNGKVVLAADVTNPDDPGPVFIVVEAPTTAYLESLLESPAFSKYQASAPCEEDIAEVVVHFTPSHIISDPRYQEWMSRFSPSTSHLCLNDNSVCMGSEAVHRIQYKLNLLSKHIFPLLKDDSIPLEELEDGDVCKRSAENSNDSGESSSSRIEKEDSLNGNNTDSGDSVHSTCVKGPVYQAATLMTYHLRPQRKIDKSNKLKISPATYMEECYETENFKSVLADARSKLSVLESNLEAVASSDSYPNITFLGTGSCIPNKTRNTSGILVNLSAGKYLMMDCGEGTYGQLVRLLGVSASDEALRCLDTVYVSHLHADHHIGFIGLLLARRRAFKAAGIENVPKLLLLAPQRITAYLTSYHANFENISQDFTLIPNQNIMSQKSENKLYEEACSHLDMKAIDMTYVIHCPSAFGVAWTHKDGWKLAYSGDTKPCHKFVEIGRNCDLLIHEATMEDELQEEARIKAHSTTSQAIKVGCDMNARHILLTHFSQRYAKVPFLQNDVPENVGIAFDNMKVFLKNFPTLHHMYKALVTMFAEDYNIMVERTEKKRATQELLKVHVEGILNKAKSDNVERPLKRLKEDSQS